MAWLYVHFENVNINFELIFSQKFIEFCIPP